MTGTEHQRPSRSWFRTGLQLVLAAGFVLGVFMLIRPGAFVAQLASISPSAIILALVLQAVIIALVAWRWLILIRACGAQVQFWPAMKMTTSATVMNLTLPTSVGGDVIRVAMGQDAGIPVSEGSAAAVLDRVIGLLVLMALVWVGLFWINIQLALVTGLAGMGFVWLGVRLSQDHGHRLRIPVFLERFSDAISMAWKHRPATVVSLTISFVAHIGSIAVAVILAQGMGVELSALGAFITFPAVILASAIPLSVGGWGLRELAAIPLMGLAGLVPEAAAAIATLFAATQLISALSGLVAFQLFKLFRSRS